MSMTRMIRCFGAFLAALTVAAPAQANMMVPIVVVTWIGMVMALIPIVVAETLILFLQSGLPFLRALWVAVAANLVSTFIGIPLAVACHAILGEAADEYDESRTGKFFWAIMAAITVLGSNGEGARRNEDWVTLVALISVFAVFFGGSWVSEAYVAEFILDEFPARNVWNAMGWVNAASYSGLVAAFVYFSERDSGAAMAGGGSAYADDYDDYDDFEDMEEDDTGFDEYPDFGFDEDEEDEYPANSKAGRQDAA